MKLSSFLLSSIIIILLPGTGVIYTVATGISKGKKESVFAALGCTAGIVPHLVLSIALSSFILHMNEHVFNSIKVIGGLYLLYLGGGMLFHQSKLNLEDKDTHSLPGKIILRGILINLLNPKLTLFFFSFLPQYVIGKSCNYAMQSTMLGLLFMLLTFLVFCGYGLLAGVVKEKVLQSEKLQNVIQQVFGVIFILFSIRILING